jgi:hypothetical protein
LDYYLERGITLKIKNIYFYYAEKNFKLILIFFHSLELVFLLWMIISFFKLGIFWIAVAIGLTQHMVLDIFSNKNLIYIYGYFLSYRIMRRFKKENILKRI